MRRSKPRVLQVFRAPVGGLFRHVRDLVGGLAEGGLEVGVVCDSLTGGEVAEHMLAQLADACRLGIHRLPMPRMPGIGDFASARGIAEHCAALKPDIVHGHGAKGGAYARLAAGRLGAKAVYTPHGGSLHYSWRQPQGALYLLAERLLLGRTDGLLFVCDYERSTFAGKVGLRQVPWRVVYNGLRAEEFEPVLPAAEARDVLYVGELRELKGPDVLIEALAQLNRRGSSLSACIVGEGIQRRELESQARRLGLASQIVFRGALPAREAFRLGRLLVVPSRAESFPYIVLEAAAARLPLIASSIGGIPEMLGPEALVPPGDAAALATAIERNLRDPRRLASTARERAASFRQRFSVSGMAKAVAEFYGSVLGDAAPGDPSPKRRNPVRVF
jgi:glycosyltransferase involved in cell wall biosynthesis